MALLVADTAGSFKHARVGALGLVMTNNRFPILAFQRKGKDQTLSEVEAHLPFLTAVEASSHGLTRFGTVTAEMTLTTAAVFPVR